MTATDINPKYKNQPYGIGMELIDLYLHFNSIFKNDTIPDRKLEKFYLKTFIPLCCDEWGRSFSK